MFKDGKKETALALNEKEFSTGSKGYFASGKVELDGKRCQVTVNCVVIGSKPK